MRNRVPKRPGAPKGNQNARKHGFYSKTLAPWQQEMISNATALQNLEPEIAVLRARIASILANDPKNTKVLTRAVATLATLLRGNQQFGNPRFRALDKAAEVVSQLNSPHNRA